MSQLFCVRPLFPGPEDSEKSQRYSCMKRHHREIIFLGLHSTTNGRLFFGSLDSVHLTIMITLRKGYDILLFHYFKTNEINPQ